MKDIFFVFWWITLELLHISTQRHMLWRSRNLNITNFGLEAFLLHFSSFACILFYANVFLRDSMLTQNQRGSFLSLLGNWAMDDKCWFTAAFLKLSVSLISHSPLERQRALWTGSQEARCCWSCTDHAASWWTYSHLREERNHFRVNSCVLSVSAVRVTPSSGTHPTPAQCSEAVWGRAELWPYIRQWSSASLGKAPSS